MLESGERPISPTVHFKMAIRVVLHCEDDLHLMDDGHPMYMDDDRLIRLAPRLDLPLSGMAASLGPVEPRG